MKSLSQYTDIAFTSPTDIVCHYAPLVKKIAHHLKARLPESVQLDDLIQAGMMGLLEASKHYSNKKGASFETYAGIRIRGSMLDEIRKNDWVPRSVHRNAREIAKVIKTIEQKTGVEAKPPEIAKHLKINLSQYHEMLRQINGTKIFNLDDLGLEEEHLNKQEKSTISEPFTSLAINKFQDDLSNQIDTLPDKEKAVLSLYYDEELNLKEIGKVMGVSESRVCQIHSQAMVRLKSRMQGWRG